MSTQAKSARRRGSRQSFAKRMGLKVKHSRLSAEDAQWIRWLLAFDVIKVNSWDLGRGFFLVRGRNDTLTISRSSDGSPPKPLIELNWSVRLGASRSRLIAFVNGDRKGNLAALKLALGVAQAALNDLADKLKLEPEECRQLLAAMRETKVSFA